jgi:hypothetical protein
MHRHAQRSLVALALSAASAAHAAGPTGLLNDTGQTQCNNGTAMVACDAATTGNASARPRQDGRFGRDVASPGKVGGGAAGFDFSRVCFNGDLQGAGTCTGALVANSGAAPSGSASTDWACTKDNVTNLIWSLQSGYGDWTTYAATTMPADTNAASRCGFNTGWRLPTRRELLSIVHYGGQFPSIDSNYFPATQTNWYWTNDPYQPLPASALLVDFYFGYNSVADKTIVNFVRLVRSGQ